MSFRYRVQFIAVIGLGLALAPIAHAQPVNGNRSGNTAASESQAEPPTDQQPVDALSLKGTLQRIASALEAANNKPESAEEHSRAQRDLQAQEDMAKWAKWMLGIGFLESLITGTGVWLVGRTLIHTRRATNSASEMLREARRTTKIALASAKEARRASQQAERGNGILEKSHRFEHPPRYFLKQVKLPLEQWLKPDSQEGEVYIFNTGHGPSKMRLSNIVFHAGKHPPPSHPFSHAPRVNSLFETGETFDLRNGMWWKFTGKGCAATVAQIEDALTGRNGTRFFMMGRIHYEDTDNIHRHVLFCRAYDPECNRFIMIEDSDYEYQT